MGGALFPTENCTFSKSQWRFAKCENRAVETEQWKYWIIPFDGPSLHIYYILHTKYSSSKVGIR